MATKVLTCFALCTALLSCSGGSPADDGTVVSISLASSYTLSPNEDYDTGVFCRIFYHPDRNKFYLTFGAVITGGSVDRADDQRYGWREYDTDMSFTGNTGVIESRYAGDYAIASDGTFYYFLIMSGPGQYGLTKYDADFQSQGSVTIDWDDDYEAGNDQLMNFTNGKLYLATLYDTAGTGPGYYTGSHTGTTYPHVFVYSTDLTELEGSQYLTAESNVPSGGSLVDVEGTRYIVTADRLSGGALYAYAYDTNWQYLGKTTLASEGSWPQGLLYEDDRFYVVFHTGEHVNGNLAIGIYDSDWTSLLEQALTNYTTSYNAQRPWIIKVGNRLYISYDVASYDVPNHAEVRDWQCHVDVYEMSE